MLIPVVYAIHMFMIRAMIMSNDSRDSRWPKNSRAGSILSTECFMRDMEGSGNNREHWVSRCLMQEVEAVTTGE